jgi:hypothetical protein
MSGLSGLTTVGGDLWFRINTALSSLGLDSLTTVGGVFCIQNNNLLPQCEACDLLDQLVGFTGTVNIKNNQMEVCLADCE